MSIAAHRGATRFPVSPCTALPRVMAPLRRLLPAGGMLLLFACCQAQNADQQSLGGVHKAGWLHQHAHQVKVDPNAPEDVAYKAKKTVWTNDLAEQQKVAYKHQVTEWHTE